ncbi:MAG TPA: Bax inhibitor-1/YccA family protein [Hyphomicrobiaceae bacterium]|nr:Bax inhibitor-1/YccA family protein [Hyphomicrobiaceae bacterium]
MAQYDRYARPAGTATREVGRIDEGLRSFMLGVYNYMAIAVALSGVVAYGLYTQMITSDPALAAHSASGAALALKAGMYVTPLGKAILVSPLKWVFALMPLAFVMFLSFARTSAATAQLVFWAFAAAMGISMSSIFVIFKLGSIAQMFFITAAAFGALSLYGYTTKKDLSAWGSFLIMGVVGIIIAMIVNIFLASSALQFAISVIGLLVFAGLTAYDTQRLKDEYAMVSGDGEAVKRASIFGALALYLDFVNMFQFMLALFGSQND